MHYARLDDGRKVIVNTAGTLTREVAGEQFFVPNGYREGHLDGGWQIVRASRLKNVGYGSPFEELQR